MTRTENFIRGSRWVFSSQVSLLHLYNELYIPFQVGSSDIEGVNIIAFRQINQFDLSGNIITSPEHLPTLSVGRLKLGIFVFLLKLLSLYKAFTLAVDKLDL